MGGRMGRARQTPPEDGGDGDGGGGINKAKLSVDDFEMISTIGEGNYATVVLVRRRTTGEYFAMKVLSKSSLLRRDEVAHTMTERAVLASIEHPFLVRLRHAFHTRDRLYLVMDFANGGELFGHLKRAKRFSEERAKFYAAEIALGIAHLHKRDIVYRDLKPENVLLDAKGHIVLTDFGLSKVLPSGSGASAGSGGSGGGKTRTFCGTPEYLAPEVIQHAGHGKPVDWWSFGTLLFEMLVGIPPFYSPNVHEMYQAILHRELRIPEFISPPARDILLRLLTRDPRKRLGSGRAGADEVIRHPFFADVDFARLLAKEVPPPFVPAVSGPGDTRFVDPEFLSRPPPLPSDPAARIGAAPNPPAAKPPAAAAATTLDAPSGGVSPAVAAPVPASGGDEFSGFTYTGSPDVGGGGVVAVAAAAAAEAAAARVSATAA